MQGTAGTKKRGAHLTDPPAAAKTFSHLWSCERDPDTRALRVFRLPSRLSASKTDDQAGGAEPSSLLVEAPNAPPISPAQRRAHVSDRTRRTDVVDPAVQPVTVHWSGRRAGPDRGRGPIFFGEAVPVRRKRRPSRAFWKSR